MNSFFFVFPLDCGSSFKYVEGCKFHVGPNQMTYSESLGYCKSVGARLAEIGPEWFQILADQLILPILGCKYCWQGRNGDGVNFEIKN